MKEQVCQYLMWRKSRPENKISAEVEEKVENAIQVKILNLKESGNVGLCNSCFRVFIFHPCISYEAK